MSSSQATWQSVSRFKWMVGWAQSPGPRVKFLAFNRRQILSRQLAKLF